MSKKKIGVIRFASRVLLIELVIAYFITVIFLDINLKTFVMMALVCFAACPMIVLAVRGLSFAASGARSNYKDLAESKGKGAARIVLLLFFLWLGVFVIIPAIACSNSGAARCRYVVWFPF